MAVFLEIGQKACKVFQMLIYMQMQGGQLCAKQLDDPTADLIPQATLSLRFDTPTGGKKKFEAVSRAVQD